MEGTFDSAKLMLAETLEYISAFEEIAKPFASQDNWTAFQEVDPETGDYLGKIQFKENLSPRLAARTYDVFRYLRDALDQALFASAHQITGHEPTRFKFPFGDTASEVEREIVDHRRCDDLHPDILKIVIASRPYEAGNRPLWAMNKMRNRNTHKILTPAAVHATTSLLGASAGTREMRMRTMSEWKSTRRQLTFIRLSAGPNGHVKVVPAVTVSLSPAFGFNGPAVKVFRDTYDVVSGLVTQIEKETARIIAAQG